MGKIFFLLAAGCLYLSPAHAKEDRTACKVSADCAVAENPCGGVRPLNKKYLGDNEEFKGKLQPLMQCSDETGPKAEFFTAVCRDKKCILEKKAEPVVKP